MRISDWSSDVCSSDLTTKRARERPRGAVAHWVGLGRVCWGWSVRPARSGGEAGLGWVTSSGGAVGCGDLEDPGVVHVDVPAPPVDEVVELGRESCREIVCQYV